MQFARYRDVKPLESEFKNHLYTGWLGDQKIFIKHYVIRAGREVEDRRKAKTEMACYAAIKTLALPKLIEANQKELYLVLEYIEFDNYPVSDTSFAGAREIWSTELPKIDAHFLPQITYDYYRGSLLRRSVELEKLGLIDNAKLIEIRFNRHKQQLTTGFSTFSHGDFFLGNIKIWAGKLTLIDFEHARQDSRLYDIACLAMDWYGTTRAAKLLEAVKNDPVFDEELYVLLLVRRSIEVLYAFRNRPDRHGFRKAHAILHQTTGR